MEIGESPANEANEPEVGDAIPRRRKRIPGSSFPAQPSPCSCAPETAQRAVTPERGTQWLGRGGTGCSFQHHVH